METDPHRSPVYEFGEFRLESEHLMLYREDEETGIPPKAVQTLLALVEKQNQIVSKSDLMDTIWADTAVEESNLSRYIHILRSILGNRPSGKPYIETLRRRGYRFSGDVRVVQQSPISDSAHASLEALTRGSIEPFRRQANFPGISTRSGNVLAVAKWQRSSDLEPEEEALNEPAPTASPTRSRTRTGFAVFLALAVIATAFAVYYLFSGSKVAPLTDKDVVLVGDFENLTGEEVFDKALRQGLSIQLQQSPFLSLFPNDRISQTLALMKRDGSEKITPELAREICIRQGLKAFITGSIARVGDSYVVSIDAVNSNTGESIASDQIEASTKEAIIPGLTRSAVKIREKLGESLSSIATLGKPLEATTSSLEALRAYSLGRAELDSGRPVKAQPFLRRAVGIDPEFAIAFMYLGQAYFRGGKRDQTDTMILRAYELRGSVNELERLQITDQYDKFITANNDARIETLTLLAQLYPRESRVRGELADLRGFRGENEAALADAVKAIELGDHRSWKTRVDSLIALGRFDEALATAEQAIAAGIRPANIRDVVAELRFAFGDLNGAAGELDMLAQDERVNRALFIRGEMELFSGRFQEGLSHFSKAAEGVRGDDIKEVTANTFTNSAQIMALAGECNKALEFASTGLDIDDYPPTPGSASIAFAWCGDRSKAQTAIDKLSKRFPDGTLQTKVILPTVRAVLALRDRNFEGVLESLRSVSSGFEARSYFRVSYLRGMAYSGLGQNEAAIAEFSRIVENRGQGLLSPLFPLAHLELARSYVRIGDTASARSYYEKFLEFWKDADPDRPELIEAKREFGKLNEDS